MLVYDGDMVENVVESVVENVVENLINTGARRDSLIIETAFPLILRYFDELSTGKLRDHMSSLQSARRGIIQPALFADPASHRGIQPRLS